MRPFLPYLGQVLTCLATALSRNAARFGLGMNTASTIVGVVNQFLSPQLKRFEESETGRFISWQFLTAQFANIRPILEFELPLGYPIHYEGCRRCNGCVHRIQDGAKLGQLGELFVGCSVAHQLRTRGNLHLSSSRAAI